MTRSDLPPDVRDRAALAAAEARRKIHGSWYNVADAVTAVVAEEIARQLQADGELAVRAERATRQELARTGLAAIAERDALQARIEELEVPLRVGEPVPSAVFEQVLSDSERVREERNDWMQEAKALQARVQLLTAALDTAIEALGWASDYVAVPWPKVYQVEPLRAALAAGVTESEASDGR